MMLLEEHLYVATSLVDDMFEHHDVLISKKCMNGENKFPQKK